MRQLSGLDTVFLNLETNAVPMHIGGLTILEPSGAPDGFRFATVKQLIESRLHLLPMFRRRLVESPLNLDLPYWIEDPEFDIEHHVRHRALPDPGDDQQLADFICDVMSTRLDRSMPLWRVYYVEGLSGGRVALLTKIHHACVDGVSGAELLSVLLDLTPQPRTVPPPEVPWEPDPIPSPMQLAANTARSLVGRPKEAWRLLRETGPVLFSAGRAALAHRRARDQAADGEARPEDREVGAAPRMRFNTTITARRAYAFRSLPLADARAVRKAYGTSLNDVVLCVCAGALRRWLADKHELPDRTLVAAVPLSVRTEEERGTQGNKVIMARTALHTEIEDPVERLAALSKRMGKVKRSVKATPARLMMNWVNVPSPVLLAQAARLYENFSIQDYVFPPYNLVISNVPGPPQPLYLAGVRVLANYPVSIPYHGLAFNITVMSYLDNLDFGLTAHRTTVPDNGVLAELLADELARLTRRAAQVQRKAG